MFEKKEAETIYVKGNELRCQICGRAKFWEKKAQLNTSLATFFRLDWVNPSAQCAICEHCGYIHWFLPSKES